ncbi:hypothetical protein EYS14_06290 [Alteromonadaceae bacterium M269]|nr:hypothetical protein EYS14_06290 [Alteromonadaceae bacterium M269]
MAIFLKAYKGYEGPLSPSFNRTFVIFRYALADVMKTRFFTAFFVLSLLLPLGLMCFLYFYHNIELLSQLHLSQYEMPVIDGSFFAVFVQQPQNALLFFMILVLGPTMISPDLRNNAMPLYLSRPITASTYILGKGLVLLTLGSIISWLPTILLFFVQSYLAGDGWMSQHWYIPFASMMTCLLWITSLSLVAFTVSAFVKWKALARGMFFGVLFISSLFGKVIENIFGGNIGDLINIESGLTVLISAFYRTTSELLGSIPDMETSHAFMQFVVIGIIALLILMHRIKSFQRVS